MLGWCGGDVCPPLPQPRTCVMKIATLRTIVGIPEALASVKIVYRIFRRVNCYVFKGDHGPTGEMGLQGEDGYAVSSRP